MADEHDNEILFACYFCLLGGWCIASLIFIDFTNKCVFFSYIIASITV